MIREASFGPLPGLANAHLQTLFAPLRLKPWLTPERWTEVEFDDDFMEVAWFGEQGLQPDPKQPLLVIAHGLEGSYQSVYIQRVLSAALPLGWRVAVIHFRSCGRELNRRLYSYHSGASDDLHTVLDFLHNCYPEAPKGLIGFSLGGNVVLKWLGENPEQQMFKAAMAVCVPLKLDVCASAIDRGFSKLYQKHLIDSLKQKVTRKLSLKLTGGELNLRQSLDSIRNFWEFDDQVTAPLHGFEGADDYYRRCSSYRFLPNILTPTLLLQAADDPFMDRTMLPCSEHLGEGLTMELSEHGGHIGFIDRLNLTEGQCFLAQRVVQHFGSFLD